MPSEHEIARRFWKALRSDRVVMLGPPGVEGGHAVAHFASKGHELFASLDGILVPFNDRDMIERLWNPYVAAWYKDGKSDPALQLLRLEPRRLQVWLDEGSLLAGIKQLFGADPRQDYAGKVVDLDLPPRIA